jgi:hypothetical protein
MDYQILASAVSTVVVIATLYYMRRQTLAMEATVPSTVSAPAKPKRHVWPMVAATIFVLIAWIPYWLTPRETQNKVTTANVEKNVRAWLDDAKLSVRVEQKPADLDFVFTVSNPVGPGSLFSVTKPKQGLFENYLVVVTGMDTNAYVQQRFDLLKKREAFVGMVDDIEIEAARSKTKFYIKETPLTMRLEKRILITGGLTEEVFTQSVDDLLGTSFLLKSIVNKAFHQNGIK